MFQVASHPSHFYNAHPVPAAAHSQHATYIPPARPSLQLPRTLSRPPFSEIPRDAIASACPSLRSVPLEYVREHIRQKAPVMLSTLSLLAQGLPRCLIKGQVVPSSFSFNLKVGQSLEPDLPTHVLAVSASKSFTHDVLFFPVHGVVLAAQCANLPRLPTPYQAYNGQVKLPVVCVSLPSPTAFSVIHSWLYTHRLDDVLKALIPLPKTFLGGVTHEAIVTSLRQPTNLHYLSTTLAKTVNNDATKLMSYIAHIKELWQDMIALGLFSHELWDALDFAWDVSLGALNIATGMVQ